MLFACETDIQKIKSLTEFESLPVNIANDIEIVYSDSGKVKMLLKSPLLEEYEGENPYREMPEGVKVFFYDSIMSVDSYLSSKYAITYDKTKIMEAKNDVVVINRKGEKLNTEHLIWNQPKKLIYSKKFVKITTADEVIFGEGFESSETFDNWTITKVTGSFYINEDEENAGNGKDNSE